jgi:hypothetical protein
MLHDIRIALRMPATHRWFYVAVIFTPALGIGRNSPPYNASPC